MTELATVLRQDSLYPHPERLVPFIGNHDTTRFFTEANSSVTKQAGTWSALDAARNAADLFWRRDRDGQVGRPR
jgi:hypothetical protein